MSRVDPRWDDRRTVTLGERQLGRLLVAVAGIGFGGARYAALELARQAGEQGRTVDELRADLEALEVNEAVRAAWFAEAARIVRDPTGDVLRAMVDAAFAEAENPEHPEDRS